MPSVSSFARVKNEVVIFEYSNFTFHAFFIFSARNEHVSSPKVQPKKRRRKDAARTSGENDAEQLPNKHAKVGNVRMKAAARTPASTGNKSSQSLAAVTEHIQDGKSHEQLSTPIEPPIRKKPVSKAKSEHIVSSKIQTKDASSIDAKDTDRQKPLVVQSRDLGSKSKVASDPFGIAHQIHRDSSTSAQLESPSRKFELSPANKVQQRRKDGSDDFLEHPMRRVVSPHSETLNLRKVMRLFLKFLGHPWVHDSWLLYLIN